MAEGWIKLHRQIVDNPLWLSEPFTRPQAWVDLLLIANHKEGKIRRRGILITVNRGQVGMSQETLAERWGWSKNKVRRFLKELVDNSQIEMKTELKNIAVSTLITITKYEEYQNNGTENETKEKPKTKLKTAPEQECKEEEERKEKPIKTFPPDAVRIAEDLANFVLHNNPTHRDLSNGKRDVTIQRWADQVDKMQRIDGRSWGEIGEMVRWSQSHKFWSKNILSGATLREKYDQMFIQMKPKKQNPGVEDFLRSLDEP